MARRLLDRNRARESRRQVRLLDRLTRQFRGRIERELIAAMSDMVERWELTREVMMPRGFAERLEATYRQMTLAAVLAFGGRILDQGKAAGLVLERKEDFSQTMNRLALQYVQQEAIRRRIQGVTETTRRQIIGALDRGYQDGIGTAEIARNVRGVVAGLARFRAEAIARTETHGAANYGSDSAAKLTGLPLKREWLAAQDERTRESHAAADGQIVGPEDAFTVGSSWLMYPGDPSGPPEEVVNCRCVLGYIVDDGIDDLPAEQGLTEAPPPAPQFAYETATMPNTSAEADAFIKAAGIALNTRLDGMKIMAMQSSLRAAMEVTERFDLQPLTGIGPSTRFGLRPIKNALAAVVQTRMFDKGVARKVSILHLPVKFGDVKEYERNRTSAIKSAPIYRKQAVDELQKLEASGKADPRVLSAFAKLGQDEYSWTYDALLDPSEHGRVTIYHEYGHVLHLIDKTAGAEINDFLAREKPRAAGWQYLVSKYGGTNDKEYIAETFSIYMHAPKSQWYRIHPDLLKIYQKLDKRK
jgi:hypothetical protein